MKSNELRIGNLIYHGNDVVTVQIIDNQYREYIASEEGEGIWPIEYFQPIELTKEWLLKAGFKPFDKDFAKNGIIVHSRKRGYVINKKVPIMQYVHQLQNYYYANRNEELY